MILIAGCDSREKLYVLSWGSYINTDLVKEFEKEFGVKVAITEATSNESMHNRIQTKAGRYDIIIPSDYMIERLVQDELLIELDFDKLPNYSFSKFDPKLQSLMSENFEETIDYSVPYFWGSLGIMYNNSKAGVKELVEENSWSILFEPDLIPAGVKVGMYDSSRDAVSAAMMYLGYSVNSKNTNEYADAEAVLKRVSYTQWGNDDLREDISTKNLDIALVYSGDYFDALYLALDNDLPVEFDMYVDQEVNNIWFDAMVIPITSTQTDLAHKFINFFLDPENALDNALYIGYCPPLTAVYEAVLEDEDMSEIAVHPAYYPGNINGEVYKFLGAEIATLMDNILNRAKIN